MTRQPSRRSDSEIKKLLANPEVATIAGLAMVVGTALLVMMLVAIGAVGSLIQQVATGPM